MHVSAAGFELQHQHSDQREESAKDLVPAVDKDKPSAALPSEPFAGSELQRRRPSMSALRLQCTADQSQKQDPQDDITSNFEVFEKIGRGSAAMVFRAVRRKDGLAVALKITKALDPEVHAMAENEFQIMSSIGHPNILRALEYYSMPTQVVMVVELFTGVGLDMAVAKEPNGCFREEVARRIFRQLLDAVSCLHEHRVVHRDIKPENVLIGPSGSSGLQGHHDCKLIDFNTARRLAEASALSPTGSRCYMPPEAHWGEPPSEASDVWALGICLQLMITGSVPTWQASCRPGIPYTVKLDFIVASDACKAVLQQALAERLMRPAAMTLLQMPWAKDECDEETSQVVRMKAGCTLPRAFSAPAIRSISEHGLNAVLASIKPYRSCSSDSYMLSSGALLMQTGTTESERAQIVPEFQAASDGLVGSLSDRPSRLGVSSEAKFHKATKGCGSFGAPSAPNCSCCNTNSSSSPQRYASVADALKSHGCRTASTPSPLRCSLGARRGARTPLYSALGH